MASVPAKKKMTRPQKFALALAVAPIIYLTTDALTALIMAWWVAKKE